MRDAAIIVNTNGYVVWMNASAEEMLGLEQHGGVGSALIELMIIPNLRNTLPRRITNARCESIPRRR